jgi:hypothetical protein|tara:strand:- start:338 stop:463 length:126 start_codon:yes stop_codon:yes gene_type:complete
MMVEERVGVVRWSFVLHGFVVVVVVVVVVVFSVDALALSRP